MDIEQVATNIVDAAIKVHRALGPGLLESAYQKCLAYELDKRRLRVECKVVLPITYDDQRIDAGYRIDLLVEDCVIIENKTVERLLPIHEAQLLTYLKLARLPTWFLAELVRPAHEARYQAHGKQLVDTVTWRSWRLGGEQTAYWDQRVL